MNNLDIIIFNWILEKSRRWREEDNEDDYYGTRPKNQESRERWW